jgi:hypothetical protein
MIGSESFNSGNPALNDGCKNALQLNRYNVNGSGWHRLPAYGFLIPLTTKQGLRSLHYRSCHARWLVLPRCNEVNTLAYLS